MSNETPQEAIRRALESLPRKDNATAVNPLAAAAGHVTRVSRNDHGTWSWKCSCGAGGDGPSSTRRSDKGNQKYAGREALDHKRWVLFTQQ